MSKAAELANLIGNINAGGGGVNRNLIINGKMAVSQRSTSATGKTTGSYYTIDRFRTDLTGFTGTYTQSTDVPSGYGFSNSYKIENTSAASSNGGTLRLDQRIEAQNLRNSGWDYTNSSSALSYNFWAKSSVAGTYFVGFRTDDGTSRQFTKAFTLSANTWTNVSFPIFGDSNLTFNNDNGHGCLLAIHIDEATGQSDSGHTLDGWQNYNSNSRTPDFTQKWTETANATFLTTGWQLEVGQNPTEFEHEPYETTLRKCQRYLLRYPNDGGTNGGYTRYGISYSISSTETEVAIYPPVHMRVDPSLTHGGNANSYYIWHANSDTALTSMSVEGGSTMEYIVVNAIASSGFSAGRAGSLNAYNNSTNFLQFDAEL